MQEVITTWVAIAVTFLLIALAIFFAYTTYTLVLFGLWGLALFFIIAFIVCFIPGILIWKGFNR